MINHELYNEKQLLTELRRGCELAFEKIYNHYSQRLYFRLLKLLKSDQIAQEILQDVFFTVWKSREKIDIDKSFRSYLFSITTNKTYDFFRKNIRDKNMRDQLMKNCENQCSSIELNIVEKEDAVILYQAIELLPPKRKEVFRLSKLEGKSYEEISHRLGISTSTISDHIVKANQFLKKYLLSPNV